MDLWSRLYFSEYLVQYKELLKGKQGITNLCDLPDSASAVCIHRLAGILLKHYTEKDGLQHSLEAHTAAYFG